MRSIVLHSMAGKSRLTLDGGKFITLTSPRKAQFTQFFAMLPVYLLILTALLVNQASGMASSVLIR